MAIESAAELVQILAEELQRRRIKLHEFAESTGIAEERLEFLLAGDWHKLTLREIATITECLDVDFSGLWSLLAQERGDGMGKSSRP
ncbi:helix-turn-helix domain-containing protein [Shinella sp.]|uniref:helix-turn-helix domain-containing protein n=1 Tax=Shinella sp. TaxID=1870904 RepID=UPI00338EBB05